MTTFADAIGGQRRVIGGPFGSKLTKADYVSSGVPVLRGSNMERRGRWIGGEFAYVSEEKKSDLRSNLARPGDIVVTQRGTLGQVSIIPADLGHEEYVISQSQMAVAVSPTVADRDFVFYYLKSREFAEYVSSVTIQTGVPHINLGILRDVKVSWPDLGTQTGIAACLSALDDKIEANGNMNRALEGIARALFKSWFVDFDPVRAKVEGRPTGLSPNVEGLFPSALTEDALGLQPEGWLMSNMGSEVSVIGGNTPSTTSPEFWGGDYAWATPKDLSGLDEPVLLATERSLTAVGLAKVSSGLLPIDTVLLSSRAPIGYLAIAKVPTAINQGFVAMVCNRVVGPCFAYLWAGQNMDVIKSRANGSTFQEISKGSFRGIGLIVPTAPVADCFEQVVRPMFDRIELNARQSRTLASLRDLLLPKLMSGAIRVRDAEHQLAANL